MKKITLIATCAFGLEAIVKREIIKLGFDDIKVSDGKVEFLANINDIAKVNLWVRCAERILLKMDEFKVLSFEDLYQGIKKIKWEELISVNDKFPVNANSVKSKLFSLSDIQKITKRAIVDENGTIEWVSGSFGSKVSLLYPMSVLRGEGAKSEFTGITFAGKDQYLDTGAKVIHAAPRTSSSINSKSISKGNGVAIYRGLVDVKPNCPGCKSTVTCESLMLDQESQSDTIPVINIQTSDIDLGHEAKIGRIDDDVIFYLMSRGIPEEEAKAMIVRGFAEPIAKELPLEYAVEMNALINLELEGTIG